MRDEYDNCNCLATVNSTRYFRGPALYHRCWHILREIEIYTYKYRCLIYKLFSSSLDITPLIAPLRCQRHRSSIVFDLAFSFLI